MRPADDPGWSSYAETILVVYGRSPIEVPLSSPIDGRARAAFLAAGLPGCFGLVTSDNPFGRPSTETHNAARRLKFADALAALISNPVRVDGLSPDRQHREIGVALPWPMAQVIEVARRWEQSAIYWFDGQSMWVIGALTVAPPWKLAPQ